MEIVKQSLSTEISNKISQMTGESIFASLGFLKLWQTLKGTVVIWLAKSDDKIVAILPGVEFGLKPLKRFQSLPDGCYTPFWIDPSLSFEQQTEVFSEIEKSLLNSGYVKLFIYDYSNRLSQMNHLDKTNCTTQLIDLSIPNWEPPDKKIQSEIRKANREGVKVIPFDIELHFDKFITLMLQTEQRHNRSPKYPSDFYYALAELAKKDNRIIWHWCEFENQPVASHINFAEGEMLLNWQVVFDKEFSFLKANQFILYQTALDWKSSGGRYLNLGASPDDAPDLKKYKSKWGAIEYSYHCLSNKNIIGKMI